MKTCLKCKLLQPLTLFSKNSRMKDGKENYCKKCKVILVRNSVKKHPERVREYAKSYYEKNIHIWKDRDSRPSALKRYSITVDDYDNMFKKQKGLCAICGKSETEKNNLSVDHDHNCCSQHKSCGKCIRGLLCHRCNKILGLAFDDMRILKSAINYLKK